MPFKKFPDDDGEAQAFPVSFGASASNVSNSNASTEFKKAATSDSKQADGEADNTRRISRNKSPSRVPAAGRESSPSQVPAAGRERSPSRAPTAGRANSPLRTPLTNGTSLSSPLSFNSSAHDQAVQTESSPSSLRLSTANVGRLPKKFHALINNNDLSKSSSKFLPQDENQKPIRVPGLVQPLPPTATPSVPNTQSVRSTSGMREPRARHNSPQESASRFFASALQQLRPTEDGSAVSLSAEQQRDEIARGRRLRRFNDPVVKGTPVGIHAENQGAVDQVTNKRAMGGSVTMEIRDGPQGNLTEPEAPDGIVERDWQSMERILGNCPDMCPESERLERERKGDLDKLERFHGDRNQTNRDLAVKKYTRTAEKHASLIRPISVLLRTMKHLLHLLNRGYDEELLNLHNFLWDRMRAIRMDLRMQHIFNQQAVLMHEQMIRFHILAMHELCEYAKGEGFSEGFDAHLNIEQMNKTSVDLFHMYDDLRKSGHSCACEAEFRGYYALLKLDKHPGYVVEPAELSLDLAKMTPETRSRREVQFARKVARACRSGNYLAFFLLARDATYLQACLMHAHFSKLRSQALASLYSSLQRNQGIPIVEVLDWLGMEGEDIEALIEYHGFAVRNYEEPYMVKEGPFLNQNQVFQTRRSKLVEEKRSQVVEDDVLSGQEKMSTAPVLDRISSLRRQSEMQHPTELAQADEEMPDYDEDEQLQETSLDRPGVFSWLQRDEPSSYGEPEIQVPVLSLLTPEVPTIRSMQESPNLRKPEQDGDNEWFQTGKRRKSFSPSAEYSDFGLMPDEHITTSRDKKLRTSQDPPVMASPQVAVLVDIKTQFDDAGRCEEELRKQEALKAEVNLVKIRLLLRKWKVRAAYKSEERQWRHQKLEEALSSFHVGLPVQDDEKVLFPKDTHDTSLSANAMELDFLQTENERSEKIERMWTELNVADVVASILKQKNPTCKFLCWKIVMCSYVHDSDVRVEGRHDKSGDWLLAKILHQMPFDRTDSEGGMYSTDTSQASIVLASQDSETNTPFFYIARDLHFRHGEMQDLEGGRGANGILFLVSESVPLGDECRRLHALVNTFQNDAKLPLLVLYSTLSNFYSPGASIPHKNLDAAAVAKILEMDELDKSKVACWTVLPIIESYESSRSLNWVGSPNGKFKGYYSEDLLKNGLSWLALKAPMQPNLRCVNIQNLVMEHLQPSFKLLSTMEPAHVTPDTCVKAFNDALLRTANDVNSAITNCQFHWPPDELIKAFEKLIGERLPSLPSPGWNEASYLRPIIEALSLCRLPEFPLVSIKVHESDSSVSLRRQKAALERVLHSYVNEICGSKHADPFTLNAVDGIIQKSCIFKQIALGRLLIPNWSLIFQQLYHVRLALLSSDPPAVVWVQIRADSYNRNATRNFPDSIECLGPTLDEMIELEYQEMVLRRNLDVIHLSTKDKVLMPRQPLPSMVAGLEESIHANVEALQESLAVSRAIPEITEVIAPPTEGELKLESMVNEFCKRVDQHTAGIAYYEDGDALTYFEARNTTGNFTSLIAGNQLERDTTGNFTQIITNQLEINTKFNRSAVSCVNDAGLYTDASDLCTGNNSIDSFTQLLQHCENVQNSIDRTLRQCFKIGELT